MKICSKCRMPKDLSKFYKNVHNKDGYHYQCKSCMDVSQVSWRRRNPDKSLAYSRRYQRNNKMRWLSIIRDYFGKVACVRCGYDTHFSAIDFHHNNPEEKETSLGTLILYKPTPKRISILDKGVLVCANCHRVIHYPYNALDMVEEAED